MRRRRFAVAVLTLIAVLPACGDGMGMMDEGLGGESETEVLAEGELPASPDEPLVWRAFRVSDVEHEHGAAFVHARDATTVTVDGEESELQPGGAVFVPAGTAHGHGAGEAWDVVLTDPDADDPRGSSGEVFRSEDLEGVPDGRVVLRAIHVELPPGGRTSVHTHPGSEFIYVTRGSFTYESGAKGEQLTEEGDGHVLPTGTPVQKRNPGEGTAAFLSWFIVEPDEPFAPEATFEP